MVSERGDHDTCQAKTYAKGCPSGPRGQCNGHKSRRHQSTSAHFLIKPRHLDFLHTEDFLSVLLSAHHSENLFISASSRQHQNVTWKPRADSPSSVTYHRNCGFKYGQRRCPCILSGFRCARNFQAPAVLRRNPLLSGSRQTNTSRAAAVM